MAKNDLESKEERLAAGLARGLSVRQAARLAGLTASTGRRRAAEPGFKDRVAAYRREISGAIVGKLADNAAGAVATLVELLAAGVEPELRLRAAREILNQFTTQAEHLDLSERIEALESETPGRLHASF